MTSELKLVSSDGRPTYSEQDRDIRNLREALGSIVDAYLCRAQRFSSDADLAAHMLAKAIDALKNSPP